MTIETLNGLREIVESEYRAQIAAIDTLVNLLKTRGERPGAEAVKPAKPAAKPPKPKMGFSVAKPASPSKPTERKAKPEGETTLAGAMRQYIGETPGRTRNQVVEAMIYSNKSKSRDSCAVCISMLIKQGDIEERGDGLYRVNK